MPALVLLGHGSLLDPESSTPIYDHADALRTALTGFEIKHAFWKEEPPISDVLRTVTSTAVYVVPVFMSDGYFTQQIVPRELDRTANHHSVRDLTVHTTAPIGTHPRITDVICSQARSATGTRTVESRATVVLIGHGTPRSETSATSTYQHASTIRQRGVFDDVIALFLDESPAIDEFTAHVSTRDVIAVPLFIADGMHTTTDIPDALGLPARRDDDRSQPSRVGNHRIWYTDAIGTAPEITDVIVARAADAGAPVQPPREHAVG